MSSEGNQVNGPYRVDALGTVTLISRGTGVYIRAAGDNSNLALEATGTANLACDPAQLALSNNGPDQGQVILYAGALGKILQTVGPPLVGAQIKLEPTAITLSVGPPGVGASITLSPESITLKVATVSYKLSATGIEESLVAVSRKADFMGHTLTAAESSLKVDVASVSTSAPVVKQNAEAAAQIKATLMQTSVSGMRKETNGILMEG